MAQEQAERQAQSAAAKRFSEFSATGTKRVEEYLGVQTELVDMIADASRHWLDRMQTEANLASDFASKLTAARTIPDAVTACQEWTSQQLELMEEDGKHLLADTQKLIEAEGRLLSSAWLSNPLAGSS
jgi:Phasin protein